MGVPSTTKRRVPRQRNCSRPASASTRRAASYCATLPQGLPLRLDQWLYLLALGVLVVAFWLTHNLLRGRIGRALIEHVYAAAAQAGASRVHWLTHETNLDAMKLYDRIAGKSGFVQYRHLLG